MAVGAGLCVTLGLAACSGLLFYPQSDWTRTPEQLGLAYRDVELTAPDGTRLSAWWLPTPGKARGTIFFLHGNAENISTHLGAVYWLPDAGYQVLLLDYRGYGKSAGKPELAGILDDIETGLKWLLAAPETRGTPVFVLGQSLGASLGGYVVATCPELRAGLSGVILDSGFARFADTARDVASRNWLTWTLQYPVAWGMPDGYDLLDVIAEIAPTPILIIHGTRDEVIDFANAEQLYAAAGDPKAFLRYDGGHIGSFRDTGNRELVLGFLARAARQPPGATRWVDDPPPAAALPPG